MQKCFDNEVHWWEAVSDTDHLYKGFKSCHDVQQPTYIVYENGVKESINYVLPETSVWNFSDITQEDYNKAKAALENNDEKTLIDIHNKYLFSGSIICCTDVDVIGNYKTFIV